MVNTDSLPNAYKILQKSIDFRVRDFYSYYRAGDKTLAVREGDCTAWFDSFVDRVTSACGNDFLPVCRMSDGEFHFIVGDQPPDVRLPRPARWSQRLRQRVSRFLKRGEFRAFTRGVYSSGTYTSSERLEALEQYAETVREISEKGILALHLSYGPGRPFQERYFPALAKWLNDQDIEVNEKNYIPFYFVYAALAGPGSADWIGNRRILLVHGAAGEKQRKIESKLYTMGAAAVHWCSISSERSLYDEIDVQRYIGEVDIAFVGAGIGKPNVLVQLSPLRVPCIDAGFIFEVWADEERKWDRPFCVPDHEWDLSRTRFLPG